MNELTVDFDNRIDVHGRYMSCSGGWDWAPYSNLHAHRSGFFTRAIWQPVYLEYVPSVTIDSVVPLIFYGGGHPTQALDDLTAEHFDIEVRVVLSSRERNARSIVGPIYGTLSAVGAWAGRGASSEKRIAVPLGTVTTASLSLRTQAKAVMLWWPNGYGAQSLYNLSVTFTPDDPILAPVAATTRVGFRHVALVSVNDSDAAEVPPLSPLPAPPPPPAPLSPHPSHPSPPTHPLRDAARHASLSLMSFLAAARPMRPMKLAHN
jgi:hypothetical protein